MAETLGDQHRHKMPHGAKWNKANMIGQWILAIAFLLLILRIIGWVTPWEGFDKAVAGFIDQNELFSYKVLIDLWLAGAIGYGLYFHLSGRVWCRFACPLAALMHIYARFTQFRIFAEKKKCISCNVCTSVCHQGIDIMSFANKGLPMEDPECVRCSACVQSCPTGVLSFGRFDGQGNAVLDRLAASPVQMRENHELSPVDKLLKQ
jgi:polyferredoxin